jgi:hypothetical protein
MSALYSIGQMNQLGDALEAAGFTPGDVTMLKSFPMLGGFIDVLNGRAKIMHTIDCDADPYLPCGCTIMEHNKGEQLEWPIKVELYLSENQRQGRFIVGHELRKELAGKPVLNAVVLDFLLEHPEFIPYEWQNKTVLFWGTIYRNQNYRLFVRGLYGDNETTVWLYRGLKADSPAALLNINP